MIAKITIAKFVMITNNEDGSNGLHDQSSATKNSSGNVKKIYNLP